MTGGEASRLEALERTLVGAAAGQVQRRRLRRRRVVFLLALAAPLILAAAASLVAAHGIFVGLDQKLATLSDDTLLPRTEPQGELGAASPAAPAAERRQAAFGVYGLAMGGVTAVSLHARGLISRALVVVRNAFSLRADDLRRNGGPRGTPFVRTRSGAIEPVPLPGAGGDHPAQNIPIFPGIIGAGDTAA